MRGHYMKCIHSLQLSMNFSQKSDYGKRPLHSLQRMKSNLQRACDEILLHAFISFPFIAPQSMAVHASFLLHNSTYTGQI